MSNWLRTSDGWGKLCSALDSRPVKRVRFAAEFAVSVPKGPGVYAVLLKPAPGGPGFLREMADLVYVGKSGNLRDRFSQHLAGRTDVRQRVAGFDEVWFWYVPSTNEELNDLELMLYQVVRPELNKVSPTYRGKIGPSRPANQEG